MAFQPYRGPAQPDDFTSRLSTMRPAVGDADPGMVMSPFADPGYAMPNVSLGNLNQMPGQEVGGWLPASAPSPQAPADGAQYDALILKAAQQYNLPPDVFRRLVGAESSFNPSARSPAGAVGLTQLMPGTAKMLGVDPTIPEQAIQGGAMYLRQMLNQFGGDMNKALAAYNWGPGNVSRLGMSNLPAETQAYLTKVSGGGPGPTGPLAAAPSPGMAPSPAAVPSEATPTPRLPPMSLAGLFSPPGMSTGVPRGRPLFPVYSNDDPQNPYGSSPV